MEMDIISGTDTGHHQQHQGRINGSIRKAMSALKVPAVIQVNILTFTERSAAGRPISLMKVITATTNEENTAKAPIPPITVSFLIFFPSRPLIRNPDQGNSGISHTLSNIELLLYLVFTVKFRLI